ncbi:hypothetical protein IOCL2690_000428100 [Leishmania lindenbergi]|uniref:Uncharacterized protein n=1 Tax=Leishmania lindenbergi TaxID=651832 RepID=A0AAW3AH03_9TRYP
MPVAMSWAALRLGDPRQCTRLCHPCARHGVGVARARLTRPSLPAGGEPAPPRGMRRVGAGMTVAAAGRPAERWAELGAEAVLGCRGRRTAATRVSGCFAPRGGSVMGRRGVAFN